MKSIRRSSFTESFGILEVDGVDDDDDANKAADDDDAPKDIVMGEANTNSFIPKISDVGDDGNGDADINNMNDNVEKRRTSLTIHDISIDNHDYSNELDISMDDLDDCCEGDFFQLQNQQQQPQQQLRKKSFLKTFCTQESELSLQSFTSMNSFSSHLGGGGDRSSAGDHSLEMGDLLFCTDEEVTRLMYGEDDDNENNNEGTNYKNEEEMMSSSSFENNNHFNTTDSDAATTTTTNNIPTNLAASLPPSSTLGTGAFSTVRLAWRTTTSSQEGVDTPPSFMSCQDDQQYNAHLHPKKERQQLVAVKIIQKSILKQIKSIQRGPNNRIMVHTAYDNIEREIATMKRLRHPNVVRLFEVIDSVESDRLYMVLEYVSLGEILSHVDGTDRYTRMRYRKKVHGLTPEGHFDESHAALYFVDILHGLAYLHRNRICHRDLKPENILLCASGIAKISDFGVAHIFEDEKLRDSKKFTLEDVSMRLLQQPDCGDIDGSVHHLSKHESDSALNMPSNYNTGMLKKTEGTWCFWSPEMCSTSSSDESRGFSGYAADLWAAGVCLYIFTTGRLPFFSLSPSDLFHLIAKAEVQYEGLGMSNELKDLLGKLLTKDPAVRAGVGDCLKHKFCATARSKRIHELGHKFKGSERQIVLSKNDVDMALSVFKSQRHAPLAGDAATATIVDVACMSGTVPSHHVGVPPQACDLRIGSNLTKSTTEYSMEPREEEENDDTVSKKARLSIAGVRLGKTMRNIFNYIRNVEVENK